MAQPTIFEMGTATGTNRVSLGFITGTGNIQEVQNWRGSPVENGSTAQEFAADKLTVLKVHTFCIDTWAILATLN